MNKSQGLGNVAGTVAGNGGTMTGSDGESTTERGNGACWTKIRVLGVEVVNDKLNSTNCWRSQKENL